MKKLYQSLVVLVGVISGATCFSSPGIPLGLTSRETNNVNHQSTSLGMAKRKMSMAEKRKRRQAKQQTRDRSFENLPPAKLEYLSQPTEQEDQPERFQDPTEAAEKAKELLKLQRESVDMLTMVTEKIKALPAEEILSSIGDQDFFVVDDFLSKTEILVSLEAEAKSLFEKEEMETDTMEIGKGEYIVSIKGGKEQYAKCPRSVELVVSTTKHVPEVLESLGLDGSACMATLRSFDRKTLKASMNLLLGNDKEEIDSSSRDFGMVVDGPEDMRRLTLYYYVVPETWNEECGGGLVFEKGSVSAQKDRLVMWKSDSTKFKKDLWKGDDDLNTFGSCIELHLVSKTAKE